MRAHMRKKVLRRIKILAETQIRNMKEGERIPVADGVKSKEERESCFPVFGREGKTER